MNHALQILTKPISSLSADCLDSSTRIYVIISLLKILNCLWQVILRQSISRFFLYLRIQIRDRNLVAIRLSWPMPARLLFLPDSINIIIEDGRAFRVIVGD